jgi:hypothetical protein
VEGVETTRVHEAPETAGRCETGTSIGDTCSGYFLCGVLLLPDVQPSVFFNSEKLAVILAKPSNICSNFIK